MTIIDRLEDAVQDIEYYLGELHLVDDDYDSEQVLESILDKLLDIREELGEFVER